MAWLTYTNVDNRWPLWENMSPFPTVAADAQAWCGYLIADAQAELETLIPMQYAADAAATPTPAALVSACYLLTRAKILEWFYTTKGRGTSLEEINQLIARAKEIIGEWVELQEAVDEGGGIAFKRAHRKDPYWEYDQDEGVEADYEL